jgi:hypothetical protein
MSLMEFLDLVMEKLCVDQVAVILELALKAAGECLQAMAVNLIHHDWEDSPPLADSLHFLRHPMHGGHALLGGCRHERPANLECVAAESKVFDQITHVSDHTTLERKSLASLPNCAQM